MTNSDLDSVYRSRKEDSAAEFLSLSPSSIEQSIPSINNSSISNSNSNSISISITRSSDADEAIRQKKLELNSTLFTPSPTNLSSSSSSPPLPPSSSSPHYPSISISPADYQRLFPDAAYIKSTELIIEEEIGSGEFGVVHKGSYQSIPVAIKCMKLLPIKSTMSVEKQKRTMESRIESLTREAQILHSLPKSPHVIDFIGVSIRQGNLAIITNYCKYGNLEQLFINSHPRRSLSPPPLTFNQRTLLIFALQAAKGISHLHSHSVIHQDIAARNYLLNDSLNLMVSDFGLSRVVSPLGTVVSKSDLHAWKWSSPEVLTDRQFSPASDCFSFAVSVWELFARKAPFSGIPSFRIPPMVAMNGERERIDPSWPTIVQRILKTCWEQEAADRPPIKEIVNWIENALALEDTDISDMPIPLRHFGNDFAVAVALPPPPTPGAISSLFDAATSNGNSAPTRHISSNNSSFPISSIPTATRSSSTGSNGPSFIPSSPNSSTYSDVFEQEELQKLAEKQYRLNQANSKLLSPATSYTGNNHYDSPLPLLLPPSSHSLPSFQLEPNAAVEASPTTQSLFFYSTKKSPFPSAAISSVLTLSSTETPLYPPVQAPASEPHVAMNLGPLPPPPPPPPAGAGVGRITPRFILPPTVAITPFSGPTLLQPTPPSHTPPSPQRQALSAPLEQASLGKSLTVVSRERGGGGTEFQQIVKQQSSVKMEKFKENNKMETSPVADLTESATSSKSSKRSVFSMLSNLIRRTSAADEETDEKARESAHRPAPPPPAAAAAAAATASTNQLQSDKNFQFFSLMIASSSSITSSSSSVFTSSREGKKKEEELNAETIEAPPPLAYAASEPLPATVPSLPLSSSPPVTTADLVAAASGIPAIPYQRSRYALPKTVSSASDPLGSTRDGKIKKKLEKAKRKQKKWVKKGEREQTETDEKGEEAEESESSEESTEEEETESSSGGKEFRDDESPRLKKRGVSAKSSFRAEEEDEEKMEEEKTEREKEEEVEVVVDEVDMEEADISNIIDYGDTEELEEGGAEEEDEKKYEIPPGTRTRSDTSESSTSSSSSRLLKPNLISLNSLVDLARNGEILLAKYKTHKLRGLQVETDQITEVKAELPAHNNILTFDYLIEERGDEEEEYPEFHPPLAFVLVHKLRHSNLLAYLRTHSHLVPKASLIKYALDISLGLQHFHLHLPHHPITPRLRSIFVSSDGHVQVSLPSAAHLLHYSRESDEDTAARYSAPESIAYGTVDERSDVWQFGLALYEIGMKGKELVYDKILRDKYYSNTAALLIGIIKGDITLTCPTSMKDNMGTDYCDLIQDCLNKDPGKRPELSEIIQRLQSLRKKEKKKRGSDGGMGSFSSTDNTSDNTNTNTNTSVGVGIGAGRRGRDNKKEDKKKGKDRRRGSKGKQSSDKGKGKGSHKTTRSHRWRG